MKHITEALVEALDDLLAKQPAEERPHCVQRQADLYEAMDDMGRYASDEPTPARAHLPIREIA